MSRPAQSKSLIVHALRVEQRPDVPLYVFGVNGRLIHQFAGIQRANRDDDGVLQGYQRARVGRHIREIRDYLMQDDSLLPNAIVVAFDRAVNFTPLAGVVRAEWGTPGHLRIPLPVRGTRKPALIVDGQQRMSALAELPPQRMFPVIVIGFSTTSAELEREQFVLVNKTKPLPRDLLNELIPQVDTALPTAWRVRRAAATVLERLRFDRRSPFYGRIRGIGAGGDGANISQAAVLDVIGNSIRRRGVLSPHYHAEGISDIDDMVNIVATYYSGVAQVWPEAWNHSPWSSRLVHGVGIAATGRLMDVVMDEVSAERPRAVSMVARRVSRLKSRCAWTSGTWPKLGRAWNELQNTSQDKRLLRDYLVDAYESSK